MDFTLGGDDMIAVEIHGDSMLPTYRATDILNPEDISFAVQLFRGLLLDVSKIGVD